MEIMVNGARYFGDPVPVERLGGRPIADSDRAMAKEVFEIATAALEREKNFRVEDADNSPDKVFKEIFVDGEVLATIYITGVSSMTLEASQKLASSGFELPRGGGGTQSAIDRAEFLARVLGGEIRDVVKSKSSPSISSPPSFSTFSSSSASISRFRVT